MNVEFYKYQGTGNDFIMIDDRKNDFDHNDHQLINKLCSRKFGIGADGLILIRDHADHNFEMVYFNADGYQSSLCGNGARCAVHFANYLSIVNNKCRFKAIDGEHEAFIDDLMPVSPKAKKEIEEITAKIRQAGLIRLKMNDVTLIEKNPARPQSSSSMQAGGSDHYLLDTGSPQYVSFVDNLTDFDVKNNGRKIRNSQRFRKEGINVNFVEKISNDTIFVRSYERGVEDETLSCGTGVTAAALTCTIDGRSKIGNSMIGTVKIRTLGGELKVTFKSINEMRFEDIYLIGPVEMVYKGIVEY
ncbi:MAG: diaminopimelate epimerase [Cytophagales bacterium]|nr:diaminopimelate epimerase [Cytophagales bacterium]